MLFISMHILWQCMSTILCLLMKLKECTHFVYHASQTLTNLQSSSESVNSVRLNFLQQLTHVATCMWTFLYFNSVLCGQFFVYLSIYHLKDIQWDGSSRIYTKPHLKHAMSECFPAITDCDSFILHNNYSTCR